MKKTFKKDNTIIYRKSPIIPIKRLTDNQLSYLCATIEIFFEMFLQLN